MPEGTHPFLGVVLVLLGLLDAVPVRLVRLVVRRVVLGLGHGAGPPTAAVGEALQARPGLCRAAPGRAPVWRRAGRARGGGRLVRPEGGRPRAEGRSAVRPGLTVLRAVPGGRGT